MLKVVACVVEEHDIQLVVLAGLICLFACHTALGLQSRARLAEVMLIGFRVDRRRSANSSLDRDQALGDRT